jgi:hypothetical protein
VARIRTIKPDFFTSADIVALEPLARLLYIAIWCEADKEGRLVWRPETFKLRYFPGDQCEIHSLCGQLIHRRLVILYGDDDEQLAYIPTFKAHQHINPRESESQLPEQPKQTTRKARAQHASARVNDAQVGREGKGREGKEGVRVETRARSAPPPPFELNAEARAQATAERPDLDIDEVFGTFSEHYGVKATEPLWRKWLRTEHPAKVNGNHVAVPGITVPSKAGEVTAAYLASQAMSDDERDASVKARQAFLSRVKVAA